jgi:hypothetical protein
MSGKLSISIAAIFCLGALSGLFLTWPTREAASQDGGADAETTTKPVSSSPAPAIGVARRLEKFKLFEGTFDLIGAGKTQVTKIFKIDTETGETWTYIGTKSNAGRERGAWLSIEDLK